MCVGGSMELAVIFEPATLYPVLRTRDQTHGLEVKSVCFMEIKRTKSKSVQKNT